MSKRPRVTVVMPVYNNAPYVAAAIDSILRQTFVDFELLIVNDGSTDSTTKTVAGFSDPRLRLINREHRGLVASLNQGLAMASGEYVAIMHGDDVAFPTRLSRQVEFLSNHPEVGILGTAYRIIDMDGRNREKIVLPCDDLDIRWTTLLGNPFAHPTVMMRHQVIWDNGLYYRETFDIDEDYELWSRFIFYARAANLRSPLLKYRVHYHSRTGQYRQIQLEQHDAIALRTIRQQLPEFNITPEEVRQLRGLFVGGSEFIPGLLDRKISLSRLYLDMFAVFLARYSDEPGAQALRHQVALRVAYPIIRPPHPSGWRHMLQDLWAMYPALPLALGRDWASFHIGRRF
jgi:glycosyltransferase involved in cell wall biosynthesis